MANPTTAFADPTLSVDGNAETVFQWTTDNCGEHHMPDSPARAFRRPDGTLVLMASNITNIPFVGTTFENLTPVCNITSRGHENPDPLAFDDRYWLQALAPVEGSRIYGLASHEYAGSRHPGHCEVNNGVCWYSSIVAVIADATTLKFELLPLPQRIVAMSPLPYDPNTRPRTGVFSTTNIVFDDKFAMFMAYIEGVEGQPNGMCLLRAVRGHLNDGWQALFKGSFSAALNRIEEHEGASTRPVCDIVTSDNVRSVVRVGSSGPWVSVFMRPVVITQMECIAGGVFYSVSETLRKWSGAKLLFNATGFTGQKEAGTYYQYPSLIDQASPSILFDTTNGALYLYLVRFDFWPDRTQGGRRDLVRIPVQVR